MECQIPNLWISAYNPSWVIAQTHKTCPVRKDCYWRITFCGVNLKVGSKSLLIPTCSKVTLYHRQACLPNSQKHTLISRITKGTGKQTIAFGRAMERRRRGRALGSTTYADKRQEWGAHVCCWQLHLRGADVVARAVMGAWIHWLANKTVNRYILLLHFFLVIYL